MTSTEQWPFDLSALRRGDSVSVDRIEKALGVKRTNPDYWRKLLQVKQLVVDYFEEEGDAGVIVTTCDEGLQILTDEQAATYVQQRATKAKKDFAWSVVKGSLVDRTKISAETRESLDRWLLKESFRLQQMRKRMPPELEG